MLEAIGAGGGCWAWTGSCDGGWVACGWPLAYEAGFQADSRTGSGACCGSAAAELSLRAQPDAVKAAAMVNVMRIGLFFIVCALSTPVDMQVGFQTRARLQ